jgi:hypothetical protein
MKREAQVTDFENAAPTGWGTHSVTHLTACVRSPSQGLAREINRTIIRCVEDLPCGFQPV